MIDDHFQGRCTFGVTGKDYANQTWYHCRTCWSGDNVGCCGACVLRCHAGHETAVAQTSSFYCDCGAGEGPSPCQCLVVADTKDVPPEEIHTLVSHAPSLKPWSFAIHSGKTKEKKKMESCSHMLLLFSWNSCYD